MKRTRLWRLAVSVAVGALLAGVPAVASARPAPAQAPGIDVCVFYGICVG